MTKRGVVFACGKCGHQSAQWAGRCPSCDAWGTIEQALASASRGGSASGAHMSVVPLLGGSTDADRHVPTGLTGVDRVLGGGLVRASVTLLAGAPGIGKSTLLLQLVARLSKAGLPCLMVSGEESHAQVAARARRLGLGGDAVTFASGRDLDEVISTARETHPFLLAVDSIQTLRDTAGTQMPGGVSAVRTCVDALVGMAKAEGIAVLMTGHVTKDGDLAGPRALEHAVDVVLMFDGDTRSGLRVLAAGKNRFGAEGETAWFEMGADGLHEIDPTALLVSGERLAGAATALPLSGRRALAVEVQALVGASDGSGRRQVTGLDARRFQLVAAVIDRAAGIQLGRSELFGASSGGIRLDDPACDLAIAAAIASAATGVAPPEGAAFLGEVALTGLVRSVPAVAQRIAAARTAGCKLVYAAEGSGETPPGRLARTTEGISVVPVCHVQEALGWALRPVETKLRPRSA